MELEINSTIVFDKLLNAYHNGYRFILSQGGSRSSKTFSTLQLLIFLALTKPKIKISIVRKSLPTLRSSVLNDFLELMTDMELYSESRHNKTNQVYTFPNGSVIEFFSTDMESKLKGRKRDICYINEANELEYGEFIQLNLRTSSCLLMDYNPSDSEHWIYELDMNKSILIKSTYKDNKFLPQAQKDEIENLIKVDANYYKIYALGERPIPHTRIYNHFKKYTELPLDVNDFIYGMDFGFNHPTTLVKVYNVDNVMYVDEILYKQQLTSYDIIREMDNLNVDKNKYIYADYSRPEIIQELRRAGYNMREAIKEVKAGIDSVKMCEIYVREDSINIWREYKMYNWKTNKDIILDEPIKLYDDCLDALRYAIHSGKKFKFNPKTSAFFTAGTFQKRRKDNNEY